MWQILLFKDFFGVQNINLYIFRGENFFLTGEFLIRCVAYFFLSLSARWLKMRVFNYL